MWARLSRHSADRRLPDARPSVPSGQSTPAACRHPLAWCRAGKDTKPLASLRHVQPVPFGACDERSVYQPAHRCRRLLYYQFVAKVVSPDGAPPGAGPFPRAGMTRARPDDGFCLQAEPVRILIRNSSAARLGGRRS
jgi:hypothetical protein